jgi:photosystem II stability/assembly factor-like uncharacterized protein
LKAPAGVYKSTNAGANWSPVTGGFSFKVLSVAVNPMSPETVYAGTAIGGVLKTTNGGGSWGIANTALTNTTVHAVAVDPQVPSTLYAGTTLGLFKSTNGGMNWTNGGEALSGRSVVALVIDPVNPSTVYAGTELAGVFKTTNGGASWSPVNTGLYTQILSLAIDPVTPTTLYAGTYNNGTFKTTNGGALWFPINIGLSNVLGVISIAVNPAAPATVYAGTYSGLYKTTNGGLIWVPVSGDFSNQGIYSIAIDPATPSTIYIGTFGAGVFRSTNNGVNWSPVNTGLSALYVFALAIDPVNTSTVYVGVWRSGVFKSINQGGIWSGLNKGLPFGQVLTLAIDPITPSTLYAGTDGLGVFVNHQSPAAFNYALTNSGNMTLQPGGSASNTITAHLIAGSAEAVSFSVSGLPSGADASFSPGNCTPMCSTKLTVATTSAVSPGTYALTVAGSPLGRTTGFTLTVSPPCPVTVVASETADGESILQTMYRFRDEVLTPRTDGRHYVDLFYRNSVEVSWMLLKNPELRSRAASTLSRFQPKFKTLIDRQPAVLKATEINDIDSLIQALVEKGSAPLRTDLENLRTALRSGTLLVPFGIRVGD